MTIKRRALPKQPTREGDALSAAHAQLEQQLNLHPMVRDGLMRELNGVLFVAGANTVLRHALGRNARRLLIVKTDTEVALPKYISSDNDTLTVFATVAFAADVLIW